MLFEMKASKASGATSARLVPRFHGLNHTGMADLDAPLRQAAKALGYEHWDMLLTEDGLPFRKFIAYLENRKIRLNKIGERPVTTLNSKDWNAHFRDYLKKLECPYNIDTQREAAIFWLASHALSFDYEDGKQVYEEKILSKQESGGETPAATNDKPLETKLDSLIHDVGINDVEIEGKTLLEKSQLLERVVRRKFSTRAVRDAKKKKADNFEAEVLDINEFPLGFTTGSESLDRAAIVLKMMYIAELRDMQQGVNQVLTIAQEYTGDPKTDSSLGRVGR